MFNKLDATVNGWLDRADRATSLPFNKNIGKAFIFVIRAMTCWLAIQAATTSAIVLYTLWLTGFFEPILDYFFRAGFLAGIGHWLLLAVAMLFYAIITAWGYSRQQMGRL